MFATRSKTAGARGRRVGIAPGAQRGAAMVIMLIVMAALLALGALTALSVRTELASVGQSRFSQVALYAAESGTSAGMEFLRNNCSGAGSASPMFTQWLGQSPTEILGNGKHPGETGNLFDATVGAWYEVSILNNDTDSGGTTQDLDGTVVLRSVGHGPDGTLTTVELVVQNTTCLASFCEHEYAQRNVTSRNDATAACSARVSQGNLRSLQ